MGATETDDAQEVDSASDVEEVSSTVPASLHGVRLDKCLAELWPAFSRSYFQHRLDAGDVTFAGRTASKASTPVVAGKTVTVLLRPTDLARAYAPQAMALDVVYEDDHLLVINKPAGLVVHPGAGNWTGTLLNGLLARDIAASALPRAGIVHRLDKDTSGLMLVGKSVLAVERLVAAISARTVSRYYVALVHGAWQLPTLMDVSGWIGRDPGNRLRMSVLPQAASGARQARTTIRVLGKVESYTLVACKLHTGRTHQIRVHLKSVGHPLVGDVVYGGQAAAGVTRQALNATRLLLDHPVTGEPLDFQVPLAPDIAAGLEQVGLKYNPQSVCPDAFAESTGG